MAAEGNRGPGAQSVSRLPGQGRLLFICHVATGALRVALRAGPAAFCRDRIGAAARSAAVLCGGHGRRILMRNRHPRAGAPFHRQARDGISMTARVGLIIPSSNRMVEQEMTRHVPPGVCLHVARLRMTGPHHAPIDQLLPRIEDAARTLVDARCDVVAFHCTATSMQEGMDGETRVLAALARAGAPRATTTATAIRNAFA